MVAIFIFINIYNRQGNTANIDSNTLRAKMEKGGRALDWHNLV